MRYWSFSLIECIGDKIKQILNSLEFIFNQFKVKFVWLCLHESALIFYGKILYLWAHFPAIGYKD